MIVDGFHPAFVLIFGALLLAVLPGRLRQVAQVALPVFALVNFLGLKAGSDPWMQEYLGIDLTFVATGKINILFGLLFHIAAVIAAVYALHVRDRTQLVSGMMYAGAAVGVALAGDFLTLFLFWELLAVTSVFQIWARKSERSGSSGIRYLILHILSGLLLMAGAAFYYVENGGDLAISQMKLGSSTAAWLIFLALGIKSAWPFFHTWLVDSYPESTPTGAVFLSAFTTKAAVCILAQTFVGTEALIWIGTAMAMFPIFYAVIENDLRRVLGYSMINQIGFMMVGIGIGTDLAVNGAVAHAFNDVLFKGLLFMSMGAVLHRTGKINGSELGGLYKSMPITTIFCIIGAASISAFPLFSGFVSKSMVMSAAGEGQLVFVWLCLLFAAAGVFHHAGIKIPFFAFFAHDSGIRCKEAPVNMLVAMGIAAFFCIYNGASPDSMLYPMLPHDVPYEPYDATHVITQTQLLFFSALAFTGLMLLKIYPPELKSTNLDVDWFYRKGGTLFYRFADKVFNGINRLADEFFIGKLVRNINNFFESGASRFACWVMTPVWKITGKSNEEIENYRQSLFKRAKRGAFPIGITAFCAVVLLGMLSVIFLLEN
jgi:multicomponent Na+:H+ antiporter subunit D